ncbi:MAG: hypothetical protein KAS32_19775 [Candidatus Peribacteraceae bacterium]|nr:hypothetical protein [Candidatus Peribacteraceae bacterium]
MSTGDERLAFYEKQLLGRNDYETYWFDFMDNKVNDVAGATFLTAGVLDDEEIGLTSNHNDTIEFDLTNASKGVDDTGRIMDLSLVLPATLYDEYPFENTNLTDYYTGFRYQSIPSAVERNPRSSEAEYSLQEETIGELDHPDSVVDDTTHITLVIDGILENGVDHKDRPVTVYLENPVNVSSSIAFWTGVVKYNAGINYLEITYTGTAGPIGQTAPEFSISLTATDYWVHVQGISWFKNTDLRLDGDYVFIGLAQGSGAGTTPTIFDTTDQVIALYISLDRAYRGGSSATPAPGRIINVDKYAVEFAQSAVAQRGEDVGNAAVVFNKLGETIDAGTDWRTYLPTEPTAESGSVLKNLSDAGTGGTDLLDEEDATLGIGTRIITFTRGAIDLTTFDEYLDYWFYVLVTGGATADNGLYRCDTYNANTATVENLDGTNPTFAGGGSPKAKVFIPVIENFIPDYWTGTWENTPTFLRTFSEEYNGYQLYMLGSPTAEQRWFIAGTTDGGNADYNEFFNLYCGRILMRGGDLIINEPSSRGEIIGNAQFQSDKVSVDDLHGDYQPSEGSTEWGFDYRGNDFNKANDIPGFQFSATFRHPFLELVGDVLRAEEAFTRFDATNLDFTRGGTLDVSIIPGSGASTVAGTDPGYGWVIAEVQYAAPNSADGIYLVYDSQTVAGRVEFRDVKGTNPNFPVGSGVVRFYGGSLFGPYAGTLDPTNKAAGYLCNFTLPTSYTGAWRVWHDDSGVSGDSWQCYIANNSGFTWGVRDGGVMFSKAVTTRAAEGTDPATGSISTALLTVGQIDFDAPAAKNSVLDIYKGQADLKVTTFDYVTWFPEITGTGNSAHIQSNHGHLGATQFGMYYIKIHLPDGDYINSVEVEMYGDDHTVGGKEAGINLFRKAWDSNAGGTSMLAAGTWSVVTSTRTKETVTFTPDGVSRLVDNTAYEYILAIRSTKGDIIALPDYIYGARVNHRPGNASTFTSVLDKLLVAH